MKAYILTIDIMSHNALSKLSSMWFSGWNALRVDVRVVIWQAIVRIPLQCGAQKRIKDKYTSVRLQFVIDEQRETRKWREASAMDCNSSYIFLLELPPMSTIYFIVLYILRAWDLFTTALSTCHTALSENLRTVYKLVRSKCDNGSVDEV